MIKNLSIFGMNFAVEFWRGTEKMQVQHSLDYQTQIDEALKKAKPKKVLYLYDESGNKFLLGVFNKKKAEEVKNYLRVKKMINRLSEFDIITTEPDSDFSY
ncbi:MAG: hypothetical protein OEY18_16295 [Candidatus Aminicenantes bacterium]|nr:hypothetical protein [Candidatus Aminicenantes bacterium]